MTPTPRAPLPRGPFVLLGLMTATTLLGPVLIGFALRGGASAAWPPDRAIEWAVVGGTSVAVLALMGACLALAVTNRHAAATRPHAHPASPPDARPAPTPGSQR